MLIDSGKQLPRGLQYAVVMIVGNDFSIKPSRRVFTPKPDNITASNTASKLLKIYSFLRFSTQVPRVTVVKLLPKHQRRRPPPRVGRPYQWTHQQLHVQQWLRPRCIDDQEHQGGTLHGWGAPEPSWIWRADGPACCLVHIDTVTLLGLFSEPTYSSKEIISVAVVHTYITSHTTHIPLFVQPIWQKFGIYITIIKNMILTRIRALALTFQQAQIDNALCQLICSIKKQTHTLHVPVAD